LKNSFEAKPSGFVTEPFVLFQAVCFLQDNSGRSPLQPWPIKNPSFGEPGHSNISFAMNVTKNQPKKQSHRSSVSFPRKKASRPYYRENDNRSSGNQLSFSTIEKPVAPALSIAPVPTDVAIASGRFYIICIQGERSWKIGIQFTHSEAVALLPKLKRWDWSLTEDGPPQDLEVIYGVIERAIDGGAA